MMQRTVLKVDIGCERCKKKLLRAVSGLEGVDKIEVDAAKGSLTVTGNADPYEVVVRARKSTGRFAEVVSVGPPLNPKLKQEDDGDKDGPGPRADHKKPKFDDHQKSQHLLHLPSRSCHVCERLPIGPIHVGHWDEPNVSCSIL